MELRRIAKDVYACLQPDRGLGWSNSGLINRGGGRGGRHLLGSAAHARPDRAVRARLEGSRRAGSSTRTTTATTAGATSSSPAPRSSAIGCAPRPSARSSRRRCRRSSSWRLRRPGRWRRSRERCEPYDFAGIELTPPTTLFDERLELDLDGVRVELLYVGPAHTPGDVIVHLPAQRVVFAGDVLFRLCTPIGWEGTFANWIAALDRIVALEPEVVVPGHGPLCGVEGPREMKAYLAVRARRGARASSTRGLPVLEAARRIDLGPYAGWTEPERLVFNVARAYREFGGEPYDARSTRRRCFATCTRCRSITRRARDERRDLPFYVADPISSIR